MGKETLDAIIAGQADMGACANWALTSRLGKPNIMLGGFMAGYHAPHALFARPGIDNLSDLSGKRLGTVQGTQEHYFFYKALDKGGVGYNDVTWVYYGFALDGLALAMRGDIDAAFFQEKGYHLAEEQLVPMGWHIIATRLDIVPMAVLASHGPIPLSKTAVEKYPDAIAGALRAYLRAAEWIKAFPDQAAKLAANWFAIDEKYAGEMIMTVDWYVGFQKEYVDVMLDQKEWSLANGFLAENYNFFDKIAMGPAQAVAPEFCSFNPAEYS
jgi:ABC-type nitrate/sulfonate/bicarbonate transport system substrate-binding protein